MNDRSPIAPKRLSRGFLGMVGALCVVFGSLFLLLMPIPRTSGSGGSSLAPFAGLILLIGGAIMLVLYLGLVVGQKRRGRNEMQRGFEVVRTDAGEGKEP